ncbi:MAG: DMT family transporter [Alphaproteobacteria bacterium]|nr:MAG: DMT family transporter [Alphaproteobacteria bacterium]
MRDNSLDIPARAWAELLLLGLIWGGSFLAIAFALREIGPLTAVLHRTGWAAALLWLVVLLRGEQVPREWRIWLGFLVMGLLNNVIPFSLMAWGQTQIETGLTAILNAFTAVLALPVAALFLADQRLTGRRLLGVGLGFAGVVVAVGADALGSFDLRALGQIAVLGGTLSYALASVWGRVMLGSLPPVVAAAGMTGAATLIMAPVALVFEGVPSLALSIDAWAGIAYYALGGTALAYLLYYRILAMAGPANLMLVTLLIPVVSIALGAAVLGERLTQAAWIGFALLALGLMIIDGRLPRRLMGLLPAGGVPEARQGDKGAP